MPELSERERLVLTKAYADPDATPGQIAAAVDVDEETVRSVLDDHEAAAVAAAATDTDWEDPYACPFCGRQLRDGGQGFIDHVEDSEACRLAFERWRENVADDVGGEWSG